VGVSIILLCNLLPGVILSPYFGGLADRWPRQRLAVVGDLVGAGAFAGLAVVPSFAATVMLALTAGAGVAISRCAVKAALPTLVAPDQRSVATALWGASRDAGMTAGPGVAAILMLVVSPELVLAANAATFATSALLLQRVDLGRASLAAAGSADRRFPLREATSALGGLPDLRVVMIAGSAVALAGGLINVAEPVLAVRGLAAGDSGYAVLVAVYGLGMLAGGWVNARCGNDLATLRRTWLAGMAVTGAGICATGAAPTLSVAIASFAVTGVGNVLVIGSEIRLLQERSPEALVGRLFGLYDSIYNGALTSALLIAGAVLAWGGPRTIFLLAGAGVLAVLACAAVCLRSIETDRPQSKLEPDRLDAGRAPPRSRPPERPPRHEETHDHDRESLAQCASDSRAVGRVTTSTRRSRRLPRGRPSACPPRRDRCLP